MILEITAMGVSIVALVISIRGYYRNRKFNNKLKVWRNLKGQDFDLKIINL